MKIIEEYYVCTNDDKSKYMDEHGCFLNDIQQAERFYDRVECKRWMINRGIETAKPLKVKATFVFR